MSERRRIFISHHHSDAKALSQMKDVLEPMGFACFLAHEDITPGEHDLDRIEKEIRDCDAFLYVGSEDANASAFCQQEIGMAKALNKKITTAMTKNNPPTGFIGRIQAIKYAEIDRDFCNKVHDDLCEKFPLSGKLKKHLETLGYDGFSRTVKPNTIHLLYNNFNDFGFRTIFNVLVGGQNIGHVRIGFVRQKTSDPTRDKLLNSFTHLCLPFFSRIFIDDDQTVLNEDQIESLKHLLNDTEVMSEEERNSIANEPVYQKSLLR